MRFPTMWHFDLNRLRRACNPLFRLGSSICCSVSSLTVVEFPEDSLILPWQTVEPWWNAALCGIASGPSLLAKVSVYRYPEWKGLIKLNYLSPLRLESIQRTPEFRICCTPSDGEAVENKGCLTFLWRYILVGDKVAILPLCLIFLLQFTPFIAEFYSTIIVQIIFMSWTWRFKCQHMGLNVRKPVFIGLRTTKVQTSLLIRAVWSAPLLFA